jgi:hypothetical protein
MLWLFRRVISIGGFSTAGSLPVPAIRCLVSSFLVIEFVPDCDPPCHISLTSNWFFEILSGCKLSAKPMLSPLPFSHTFKVEEHIGLVVLEHLSDQLHIHVLNVHLLETPIHYHHRFVEFLLYIVSTAASNVDNVPLQCW